MSLKRPFVLMMVILTMALAATIPLQAARADTGPKPTMDFAFTFEMSPAPAIVSGIQYECHQADCSDAKPLMVGGPQRFTCDAESCSSLAYGYEEYHRLSIVFSDGVTRQSNVFGKRYFVAAYRVTVRSSDLMVEEIRGGDMEFLFSILMNILPCLFLIPVLLLPVILLLVVAIRAAEFRKARLTYIAAWLISLLPMAVALVVPSMLAGLLVTLAVEMALAVGYVLWRKRSLALLLTVVWMMNLITRPLFSLVFGDVITIAGYDIVWTLAAELIIVLVEAGILALALRKEARFREALLLSLALNAASFGIGMVLPF
jgi:hypothetical protein